MPTALAAPITVWTSLSSNGAALTVNWTDPNGSSAVSNFTVTFRNGAQTYTPNPSVTAGYATSITIAAQTAANAPTLASLSSNYTASVVANPANSGQFAASAAGVQVYAATAASLSITIGGKQFQLQADTTVTPPSGIYRLATSPSTTVTLPDITSFVGATGYSGTVPQSWPNSTPIVGTLTLSKLAVFPPLGLFDLEIAYSLGTQPWNPFPGFGVQRVALTVVRNDGNHSL